MVIISASVERFSVSRMPDFYVVPFPNSSFVKIFLRHCHALMVEDGAFSNKIDYSTKKSFQILNLEEHPNCTIGSRVTAILLNWWILPIGGASAMEGLRSTGLPRLLLLVREG